MGDFAFLRGRERTFTNIIVHPVQEMRDPATRVFFRGGPDWPHFHAQVLARHCWGPIPWPVDSKPRPADGVPETADAGIWCGPIAGHFGHMIGDFAMRIAESGRVEPGLPLVFSSRGRPPAFFWDAIEHLGIERSRIMLVRKATRFARLSVVPQAERRFGGGPSRAHLDMMDAIAGPAPADRDIRFLFVSRANRPYGHFAGASYLDEVLAAAGVTVFHPETVNLREQLRLYRRAQCLIFSEGSAVHALQLLGRLDAAIVVLNRRPGKRIAAASLRPRARSLRYVEATRALVHGLQASGKPQPARGISILDEQRCIAALASIGVDVTPFWEARAYAGRRDADIAEWMARRLSAGTHEHERDAIDAQLRALSVRL